MISHGKNVKVFCANANRPFAEGVCRKLWLPMGDCAVNKFADGEVSVSINESVRGSDVFIVQSTCKPVNDNLMELLVMIDACRRASAGRITAVMPYFGYARQDRKAKGRDPISAKLVANMIEAAGADRVLTMDLHAAQIQGFFDIPVDNLHATSVFTKYFLDKFDNPEDMVVVSPDVGSVARSRSFANKMGMGLAIGASVGMALAPKKKGTNVVGKALKAAGTKVQLDPQESADYIVEKLKEKFII